jgi:alpha-ketoglutarate-dependent taurine dioxygenase
VLFKDASFKDEADFETNCHHCGKPIMVEVQRKIIIIVKPIIRVDIEKNPRDPCGKPC